MFKTCEMGCVCVHVNGKLSVDTFFSLSHFLFVFCFWSIKYLSMSSKRINTGLNVRWEIFLRLPEDYKVS